MDRELLIELAESAQERGQEAHKKYLAYQAELVEHQRCMRTVEAMGARQRAQEHLNDSFYWFGHANAYKGVAMLMEREEVGT